MRPSTTALDKSKSASPGSLVSDEPVGTVPSTTKSLIRAGVLVESRRYVRIARSTGMLQVRRPARVDGFNMPIAYTVHSTKQPDLQVRDFAVDAVEWLAVRVGVVRPKHIAQPALSYALDVDSRVRSFERPVTHPKLALPLLGHSQSSETILFTMVSEKQ